MADLAFIHNLADLALWTAAGSHAKPRFTWVYNDADGQSSFKYRVRVYTAASGGSTVCPDGEISSVQSPGNTMTHDCTYAMPNGDQGSSERWWTVEVWDASGESSGESARTAFKVLWGQGLYEYNAGSGSSAWSFSSGSTANQTQAAFLFRGATSSGGDGASGKTAFYSQIGQVPLTGITYAQVLVRMATQNSTTQPALPDMTLNYLGGALIPDRWNLSPGAEWALDESVRRYGSRALKCSTVAATAVDRTAYPYRITAGDDVPVTPFTTYTWSVFVRTQGPTTSALTGGILYLIVWTAGGVSILAATDGVTDTSDEPDGWKRISVTATTGEGDTYVRPEVRYSRSSGVNEAFWMDAMSQEEGNVATTWRAGGIGKAVVVDVQGIVIDGMAGGIFRVRGSAGGARDVVELGPHGLLIGGITPLRSVQITSVDLSTAYIPDADLPRIGAALLFSPGGNEGVAICGWFRDGTFNNIFGFVVGQGGRIEFRGETLSAGTASFSFYIENNTAGARIALKANTAGFGRSFQFLMIG